MYVLSWKKRNPKMSNVDDLFSVFDEQNDDDNGPVPVVEPASSAPAKQPSNDAATSKKRFVSNALNHEHEFWLNCK